MADYPMIFSAPMVQALLDGRKTQTRRILGPGNTLFDGGPWTALHKAQTWDWDGAWVDDGPSPAGNPGPYLKLPWMAGDDEWFGGTVHRIYPRVQPGDRLWVKEACATWGSGLGPEPVSYPVVYADDPDWEAIRAEAAVRKDEWKVRSPIHMPRWASRLTLPVSEVRVQRVQDISEVDAVAEGIFHRPSDFYSQGVWTHGGDEGWQTPEAAYRTLWNSLRAKPKPVKGPDGKVSHYVSYPWEQVRETRTFRNLPWIVTGTPWVAAYTFTVQRGNIDQVQMQELNVARDKARKERMT